MVLSPSQTMCFLNGMVFIFSEMSLDTRERLLIRLSSCCRADMIRLSSSRESVRKDIWVKIKWLGINSILVM
jgi:hypothetical protein